MPSTLAKDTNTDTDQILSQLLARPDLPPLEPGKKVYNEALTSRIKGLDEHPFVIAAIHLLNDDIHNAHLIAQDNEGNKTADLLHATLHRREGDYWNSKYWYSHVRSHPTIVSEKDAKSFVDACSAVKGRDKDEEGTEAGELRERQWRELKELVVWVRANC